MKLVLGVLTIVMMMACGEVVDPTDPDPCADGNCECTAATEDTDCSAHQFCNETATGKTCECVAGYTAGVNGCVWTGVIKDPALMEQSTWTPVNGALMNPTAVGGTDPGEASFLPSALCALAHVKQTVDMPAFEKAEPLVLELSYKNQVDFNQGDQVLMGVSFGGGWSPFPYFFDADFHSVRICLPEGGYAPSGTAGAGGPVTFAFGPYAQPYGCPNSSITNFAVDHVAIVPANAGECGARPGEGVNFDAEGTGGWTFTVSGSSSGGFASGIGVGGSRAARINLAQRCESAAMETWISVPAVDNPALEMFVGANAGANPTITFGQNLISLKPFDTIPAATTTRTLKVCLPPAMRGQALSARFSLSVGGVCSEVLNHQVFADNVRVIDDPTCASRDGLSNPGFEHTGQVLGTSSQQSATTSLALVRNVPGQAHGGTRYLALESYRRCVSAGYTMMPLVPAPSGAAGPALKFFANVGTNVDASTSVSTRGSPSLALTEGGGYRPYTFCLNPVYAGRPALVSFSHNGGGGTCDNTNYGTQTALIDDLELTTDPMCPAQ
ncbi:MAG TPA: hypothetical protein VK932_31515 [Kofleriaceae bacterium]|nr:hypothetical protein [Kofleriaceae bacterium]